MKSEDRQLLASVAEGYAGDNVLENWESVAEEFYRDTRFLRPGKSYPLGCEPDPQERNAAWNTWVKARGLRIAAAIRALLIETSTTSSAAASDTAPRGHDAQQDG